MRLTYVNRRFLDYYVPVLAALDRLVDHQLHVIYSRDEVPQRIQKRLISVLGGRAIGMTGEWKYGGLESEGSTMMANQLIAIRYQPGLYSRILSTNPDVVI